MQAPGFRAAIRDFIRAHANPPDKFSHQARLYAVAVHLATEEGRGYDDEVLYAAAWMHDLGVFIGHRPEDPTALAAWNHIAYVMEAAPEILRRLGFPESKIGAVLEVIRTHLPSGTPTSFEGSLLRDADILEQLGAVGVLRTVSKVGRDTRFVRFSDALNVLRRNLEELPPRLQLASARGTAQPRVEALRGFLAAADAESGDSAW
jgi:uncharacterized protein